MRLGLVARGDRGGIAAQTWELWRHLHPVRTLLIDMGPKGRGPTDRERFAAADWDHQYRVTQGLPTTEDCQWLADHCDVVWAVETPGNPAMGDYRAVLVIQANPELYWPQGCGHHVPVLPTPWERHRIPQADVLPMPVATDVLPFRQRLVARTFVHVAAPAFHDRNGTKIVLRALRHVTQPCGFVFRGPGTGSRPNRIGVVEIFHDPSDVGWYWQAWPEDADVLVLPRRYGGLSLPMGEASALGMPTITMDLPPQNQALGGGALLVQPRSPYKVEMRGGAFDVWDADPRAVAMCIDLLVKHPDDVAARSLEARTAVERRSWDVMVEHYRRFLGTLLP